MSKCGAVWLLVPARSNWPTAVIIIPLERKLGRTRYLRVGFDRIGQRAEAGANSVGKRQASAGLSWPLPSEMTDSPCGPRAIPRELRLSRPSGAGLSKRGGRLSASPARAWCEGCHSMATPVNARPLPWLVRCWQPHRCRCQRLEAAAVDQDLIAHAPLPSGESCCRTTGTGVHCDYPSRNSSHASTRPGTLNLRR